jgi:hypothetical protein
VLWLGVRQKWQRRFTGFLFFVLKEVARNLLAHAGVPHLCALP